AAPTIATHAASDARDHGSRRAASARITTASAHTPSHNASEGRPTRTKVPAIAAGLPLSVAGSEKRPAKPAAATGGGASRWSGHESSCRSVSPRQPEPAVTRRAAAAVGEPAFTQTPLGAN